MRIPILLFDGFIYHPNAYVCTVTTGDSLAEHEIRNRARFDEGHPGSALMVWARVTTRVADRHRTAQKCSRRHPRKFLPRNRKRRRYIVPRCP